MYALCNSSKMRSLGVDTRSDGLCLVTSSRSAVAVIGDSLSVMWCLDGCRCWRCRRSRLHGVDGRGELNAELTQLVIGPRLVVLAELDRFVTLVGVPLHGFREKLP